MASIQTPRTQWHEIQGKDACKQDKKRKHLIIEGYFPNSWAKMKGTAP